MEIVRTVGLKKYFRNGDYEVHALDGIDITISEGELAAIVGSSGSGKTTLLNLIGGLDLPTEGHVLMKGRDLYEMSKEERTVFRRRNIGFVFQQFNLIPILNVFENIILPLRLDGVSVDEAFFREVTSLLKLEEKLEQMPETLSGGQQQRAAIARALMMKPAIVLADEPTGSLDARTSVEVTGLLKMCSKRFHQTVVLVTHDIEAAQMADRIISLEEGKVSG